MSPERQGVAVYGATGYTGRQIAEELIGAGHRVVLGGRDPSALSALAEEIGGEAEIAVARLDEPAELRELCAGVTTVIHAAGTFTKTCEPVVRAAIESGTHYIDISGQPDSVKLVFDRWDRPARERGIALLPSTAFYATLADLLVTAASRDLGRVRSLDIAYEVRDWVPSGSAFVNFLEGAGKPIIQYDGDWLLVTRLPRPRSLRFAGDRRVLVTLYPAPEAVTIPRHLPVDRLRTWMAASTLVAAPALEPFVPQLGALLGRAMESPAAGLVERAATRITGASRERVLADPTTFDLVAHLEIERGKRVATLSGPGIFDVTAPIASRIAAVTLEPGFDLAGAATAPQVVDPVQFLDALELCGVSYELGAVAEG